MACNASFTCGAFLRQRFGFCRLHFLPLLAARDALLVNTTEVSLRKQTVVRTAKQPKVFQRRGPPKSVSLLMMQRLDISKQAVSQSVAELEALGVVELLVDPEDARAKLVRFTSKGAESIAHGLRVLGELERELEAQIGKRQLRALHQALLATESALESEPNAPER